MGKRYRDSGCCGGRSGADCNRVESYCHMKSLSKNGAKRIISNKLRGYITIEYAIVSGAIFVALLAPIPGVPGGHSMVDMIMDAIKHFQAHTTTMLALP